MSGDAPGTKPEPDRPLRDEEVEQLATRLDHLLGYLLERAEPEVAVAVAELIEGLERIHAEGLRRLVKRLPGDAERLGATLRDPAISRLFEMYDLKVSVADDEAARAGRGSPTGDVSVVPAERLVQLRRRAVGAGEASETPGVEALARPTRLAEVPLESVDEDGVAGLDAGGVPLLVVRRGGHVYAYRNRCPGTPFPLHEADLDGDVLVCPWHGCRFELASGRRTEGEGGPLEIFPLEVDGPWLRIGLP